MEKQLERFGLSEQSFRISAVDGDKFDIPKNERTHNLHLYDKDDYNNPIIKNKYMLGSSASMCIAISIAKWYQQPYFLYLEDDAILFENVQEFVELHMKKLPDDWDIMSFGAMCRLGTTPINKLIAKPNSPFAFGAHFVLFRHTAYDKILRHMGTGPALGADMLMICIDDLNLYCMSNGFLPQKEGYSDTVHSYLTTFHNRHSIDERVWMKENEET
jgi:hypothetical protein